MANMRGIQLKQFMTDKHGNIAMLFAFMAVPAFTAVGMSLDYARAQRVQLGLQVSLDSAVISGKNATTDANHTLAKNVFASNFGHPMGVTVTPAFSRDGSGNLKGTASASVATTISAIMNIPTITVRAAATAGPDSTSASGGATPCIHVLDPTATQALYMNSDTNMNAPLCEIHVSSTAGVAAKFVSDAQVAFKQVKIGGGKSGNLLGTTIETNSSSVYGDPYFGRVPAVTVGACDWTNLTVDGGLVNPGVYCGATTFGGSDLVINPGLYVFKSIPATTGNPAKPGTLTINSTEIHGDGVTFYFADNKAKMAAYLAKEKSSLKAPTSGPYNGLLMFEAVSDVKKDVTWHSGDKQSLEGVIYLPSWNLTIDSTSDWKLSHISMAVNKLVMISVSKMPITPYIYVDGSGNTVTLPGSGPVVIGRLTN
jgi:Flp pilus assembly protein TadG